MDSTRETLRPAVRRALEGEHLFGCRQNSCDICMAADLGYDYLAAEQLLSATEAPHLAAALAGTPAWRAWARAEFRPFGRWFARHTVECPGCGAFVRFAPDQPTTICANCLAAVPQPVGRKDR
jgi:hypothetical protein